MLSNLLLLLHLPVQELLLFHPLKAFAGGSWQLVGATSGADVNQVLFALGAAVVAIQTATHS